MQAPRPHHKLKSVRGKTLFDNGYVMTLSNNEDRLPLSLMVLPLSLNEIYEDIDGEVPVDCSPLIY